MSRIKRKIESLREQPDHVRLRAATLLTAASGIILVGLWLTVLLPAQLHISRSRHEQNTTVEKQAIQQVRQDLSTVQLQLPQPTTDISQGRLPQIGGAQDINLNAPTRQPTTNDPQTIILPDISVTPTPVVGEPTTSEEPESEVIPAPTGVSAEASDTVPVQITE